MTFFNLFLDCLAVLGACAVLIAILLFSRLLVWADGTEEDAPECAVPEEHSCVRVAIVTHTAGPSVSCLVLYARFSVNEAGFQYSSVSLIQMASSRASGT